MKTVTTKIYQFSELSKAAKQKAVEKFSDINIDYDWWDLIYDEAAELGIKITGHDISYRHEITGEFTDSAITVAGLIRKNHGRICESYKIATNFLKRWKPIAVTAALLGTDEADEEAAEKFEELEADFLKYILEDYLKILSEEYSHLQTDEAIKEAIEANEYDFYKDGSQYVAARSKNIA